MRSHDIPASYQPNAVGARRVAGNMSKGPNTNASDGSVRHHANGVTGISALRILVADLAASIGRFKALVGPDAVSVDNGIPRISINKTVFELVGPDREDARRRLAARGEGVLSLKLRGSAARALEVKLLHGADLTIVA